MHAHNAIGRSRDEEGAKESEAPHEADDVKDKAVPREAAMQSTAW